MSTEMRWRAQPPFRAFRTVGVTAAIAAILLLVPVVIGLASARLNPTTSLQAGILALLALPAFLLALFRVRLLVPYNLLVWAIAPEIRRVADWAEGTYHWVSLLSLAPVLTSAMVIIPVLRRVHKLERRVTRILIYFSIALLLGSLIGIAKNGLSSMYDLANYLVPLLLLPFFAIRPFDAKEMDRTLFWYSTIAIGVAVYGIFQYLTVPPWDAFWMNNVDMNSIGKPYPLEIRVFSTLNSPGPAAIFLTCALVPMIVERRWRGPLGWFGVLLVTICLLTTLVRSSWIVLVVMLLVYLGTSPGRGKWRMLLQVLLVIGVLYFAVPKLPGAEGLVSRMETMGDLKEDQSYNDRLKLLITMVPAVIGNPVGDGLGSVGTGTKLGNDGSLGPFGIMDNGFLALFITFGLPGGFFFFTGLAALAKHLITRIRRQDEGLLYIRLAFASWTGAVCSLISDNGFPGMRGFLIWMLISMGFMGIKSVRAGGGKGKSYASNEHKTTSA